MNLTLRLASQTDEELLLNWANDPSVRCNSFSTRRIEKEDHRQWLSGCLADRENCFIFIAESEFDVPVGQVRFERKEGDWQIDYSLDRKYRERGLGPILLKEAIACLGSERNNGNLVARVKTSNEASLRVFERLGFESERYCDVVSFVLKEGAW
jgi:RimJ/RimL family protein N-acetyltransferase